MSLQSYLGKEFRVVYSLMSRDVRIQTRSSPLGPVALVAEPLATILVMTTIFSYVRMRGMDLGEYLMIFFSSAIVTLSTFRKMATGLPAVFGRNKNLLYFQDVRPFELILMSMIVNAIAAFFLFCVIIYFFVIFYDYDSRGNLILCTIPIICNGLLGLGFGVTILIVSQFFKYITTIAGTLLGPINILSGMFYTAETVPPQALVILQWNPLFHSTELMREIYYYEYISPMFDPYYYYGWVIGSLAVGLGLERLLRHRILAMAG